MTKGNAEPSRPQGDSDAPASPAPPPPAPPLTEHTPGQSDSLVCHNNTVFKSGPLFVSSKGIGWTSWKKRWFILTRTSLVFFRSDPNAILQKGSEVNLTLGGIDLNSSGSVVVKADKKLLTVLFPDGREGRAFTLKAETVDDLNEWKVALELALSQAPNAACAMGQNGIINNDQAESVDVSAEQLKDKQPLKPMVLGRPILLALEDVDGTPSFLEKALRFMEECGVKVEGILRQAADVEDVERRLRDYEQGKTEFSPEEDAHVVGDCIKYVLRELPSSPVPASCCNALLEACRTDRSVRVNAMRAAVCETFPEPNRRLLQRILMMMQTVASHKAENRMSSSAVAACMAPLLLRPLLAGDCEIESDFNVGGDGSIQLLKAAAAANHAQAIVITLLEEYDNIFGEGSISADLYTDSEESESESEEATDDDLSYEDEEEDGSEEYTDDEDAWSDTGSLSVDSTENDHDDDQDCDSSTDSRSPKGHHKNKANQEFSPSSLDTSCCQHDTTQSSENSLDPGKGSLAIQANESAEALGDASAQEKSMRTSTNHGPMSHSITSSNGTEAVNRHGASGRTSARKNLSMESLDCSFLEEEVEIQTLEATKCELQQKITEEAKENAILQADLGERKKALHERRLALEQDVARLEEVLQKERDLKMALEAGLKGSCGPLPNLSNIDEKTKVELEAIAQADADIINLNQKVNDLGAQLDQHREHCVSEADYCTLAQRPSNHQAKLKDKQKGTNASSHSVQERSRSKDTNSDGAKGKKVESTAFTSKNTPHEPDTVPSSNSKKSGSKADGTNSATSTLTKLTTRLNFLKDKRTQTANESENTDKGKVSGQTPQNLGKGSEADSFQSRDDVVETEDQLLKDTDGGKRSEGQTPRAHLDKGKSESHVVLNSDNGRESQAPSTSRINSR